MLPGNALDKLLCSFSPAGDKFALAGPDGRVRVFDADSGKANGGPTANGHLVEAHTCIVWVPTKEKGKKKQSVESTGIALGTAAGDVKLYNVQLGELKWRAMDAVQGGVRSLAFSSEQGQLLATGNNGSLVSLSIPDGEVKKRYEASKYPITAIAIAPGCIEAKSLLIADGKHVFGGGSSMQLWDVSESSRSAKYTGHPNEVRAVVFVPGQPHAVSAGSGERQVAVWEVPPAKKSKKQHPAVTTLNLEDPAVQLDAACVSEGETFNVAAVSEGGEAFVWVCHRESVAAGDGSSDSKPGLACQLVMRVRVGEGAGKGSHAGRDEAILGIRLQQGPSGPTLLVARGNSAKPAFETLAVPAEAPDAAADVLVLLRPVGGVLLPRGGGADAKKPSSAAVAAQVDESTQQKPRTVLTSGPGVTVLGTDNIGQPVVTRAAAEAAVGSRKRGAENDDPEAAVAAAAATRSAAPGADDEEVPDLPEGEVPLGERVAELEARSLGTVPPVDEEPGPSAGPMPAGSSKADSLSVLLTQAIRSNDRALLERCLATSNSIVIANTVARIVPLDAARFLKARRTCLAKAAAVDRLVSKPSRAVQLVPWIRAVLHHHTAYLMSAPGVQPSLTSLFQAIDARVKLQDPLLRLYGRLGLVLHHSRDKGQLPAEQRRPVPEVLFEDDLDAEEEPAAEDPFAPALSSADEDGSEDDDSDDDDADEENEFDAMLADGPTGRGSQDGEGGDDDDDDEDLGSLLDSDDE
ncbi:hypothetical protein VOLCADRAFT_104876 [Volvox carteri f. nagariensis]|uniref:Small-subunit processome Utp12 domain-containing protein n=1 Tax=Volvox carteri f. nagariensis TaxID=3068 RepID=D8TWP6_VOLCA|nr:uncharacterized protein VOLCADRAFT_104876 [Volvox carteri f. nagariensis]EFJ48186.1 hypothetical protein VOLCADRAFT_104876 [Volvox carteri f. nagariensis]|eukprot:XP_002950871.1 hypothetical protein VOLCADRAFT_104876 [Volvox carteri f. nagariensis]